MLQKPEKGVYNRLSRRQVLKVCGVGMGAMVIGAVSGCTTKLFEYDTIATRRSSGTISLSAAVLFPRTTQANVNLDKKYLVERHKELKRIAKMLKKGEGDPAQLARKGRRSCYETVDHWTERGLLQALDDDLKEVLTTTQGNLVLPGMKDRMKKLQPELGLSEEDVKGWEKEIKWDKGKLLEAIRREGSEKLWRRWLAKSFSTVLVTSTSFVPLQPMPAPPGLGPWAGVWAAVVYILFHEEETGPGDECVPSPCPGIIIPTPPSGGGTGDNSCVQACFTPAVSYVEP